VGRSIRALRNVPPVLRILWDSGPAVVTWGLILRVLVAFMPWAIGKAASLIIGGVKEAIDRAASAHSFLVDRRRPK